MSENVVAFSAGCIEILVCVLLVSLRHFLGQVFSNDRYVDLTIMQT